MKEMWDERYSKEEYAYGILPNNFLKEALENIPIGSILFPAEGEGRNAVYAAKQGFDVTAFDISVEGRKKALKLAEKEKVNILYEVGELTDLNLKNNFFDVVALIYAHFPPNLLSSYHREIAKMIKSGGYIVLEGFSKNHLPLRIANPNVGGPNSLDMLFSIEGIKNDFSNFEILKLEEVEIELNEGIFHNGKGKVIRYIGQKK